MSFKLRGKDANGEITEDKSVRDSGRDKDELKKQVRRSLVGRKDSSFRTIPAKAEEVLHRLQKNQNFKKIFAILPSCCW